MPQLQLIMRETPDQTKLCRQACHQQALHLSTSDIASVMLNRDMAATCKSDMQF